MYTIKNVYYLSVLIVSLFKNGKTKYLVSNQKRCKLRISHKINAENTFPNHTIKEERQRKNSKDLLLLRHCFKLIIDISRSILMCVHISSSVFFYSFLFQCFVIWGFKMNLFRVCVCMVNPCAADKAIYLPANCTINVQSIKI